MNNKDIIDPTQSKEILEKTLAELKIAREETDFGEWSQKDRIELLQEAEHLEEYAKVVKLRLFQSRVKSKLESFQKEFETELKANKTIDLTVIKANFEEKLNALSHSIIQLQEDLKNVA